MTLHKALYLVASTMFGMKIRLPTGSEYSVMNSSGVQWFWNWKKENSDKGLYQHFIHSLRCILCTLLNFSCECKWFCSQFVLYKHSNY